MEYVLSSIIVIYINEDRLDVYRYLLEYLYIFINNNNKFGIFNINK